MFDPVALFAARPPAAVPYPTREAALAAVARGAKALVEQPVTRAELARFVAAAEARGLAVVAVPDRGARVAYALRADLDDAWRIPALRALRAGTRAWSDAAEDRQSELLGYTATQRRRWLALHREHQAAWGALTLYALLDRAQRAALAAPGGRRGEARAAAPIVVFRHATLPLAVDARRRVPRGLVLARFAVPHEAVGLRGRPLQRATIEPAALRRVLASPVAVRGARGWRERWG